ncbi:hypothetical protein TSACC_22661 [Terrimicrobium sacchariphilum]|uniref:Uncharacterized protein n=1 Tax=Terrimicrobium sacchariphilum TaxID=690879 RepID=A0A146GCI6_TERSA|nr:hypothetical protein [Terrimicrobium sacchariphilum]GAT34236.1 hypothetical protein TSACC_22661 [Terrimicrobium sacchariphilum]
MPEEFEALKTKIETGDQQSRLALQEEICPCVEKTIQGKPVKILG